jgi:hypothetical protein
MGMRSLPVRTSNKARRPHRAKVTTRRKRAEIPAWKKLTDLVPLNWAIVKVRLIDKTFHRYSERMLQTDLSVFGASSNS